MTTMIRSKHPRRDDNPEFAIICDWLASNSIDEWVPEQPVITLTGGQISYRSYVFEDGGRGFDTDRIKLGESDVLTEDRTVPLLCPPTGEVRAAFAKATSGDPMYRAMLIER